MTSTRSKRRKDRKRGQGSMARRADRYELYLDSVQEPSNEVEFFNRAYRKDFNGRPKVLREDFCGTAAVCYEWAKGKAERRAIGVDWDPEPLRWGRQHLAPELSEAARQRVELREADVRTVDEPKADVLAAQNFSFWSFKTRPALLEYFRAARSNLAERGVMVLDMMGGSEVMEEDREEEEEKDEFTYVWEQKRFDPITHHCSFRIHFRFPDGSEKKNAFRYEWRLWMLPEVQELLTEAGFDRVDVYWEDTGEDGEGNDVFRVRKHAEADPAWIAYLVAVKSSP